MGVFDDIKKNFNDSELGGALNSLPSDTRTPEQKMQDMIANNPNTPVPLEQATPAPQQISMAAPTPSPITGPSPASQTPFVPVTAQSAQATPATMLDAAKKQANLISGALPNAGMGMQQAGINQQAQAQAEGYGQQANALQDKQKSLDDLNNQQQENQKQREDLIKESDAKFKAGVEDLGNDKIDSGRLWKNASTGQKVLAGIGLALSAFGGPDAVAKTNGIIQNAIDRDIQDQVKNHDAKKDKLNAQMTVYDRMMNQFKNKDQALAATKAYYNEKADNELQRIVAGTGNKTAIANAKILSGQLQSAKDAQSGQLLMSSYQTLATQAQNPQVGQVLPQGWVPKTEDQRKTFVPYVGNAMTEKDADYIKDEKGKLDVVNNSIDKVLNLRNQTGALTPGTPAHSELVEAGHALQDAFRQQKDLKRISPDALEFIKSTYADPAAWEVSTIDRLKNSQKSLNNDFVSKIKPRVANFHPSFSQSINGKK